MPIDFFNRAKNAWNAFVNNKDPTKDKRYDENTYGYSTRPDRTRFTRGVERSILNAVYNRIAIDVASVDIRHVRLDENDRYLETIDSDLNECLATEANIDQTGRSFIQDIVMSMFDEGVVAVIPVDTDTDPDETGSVKIYSMRTAKIIEWKPQSVRVRAYNDRTGKYEEIDVLKCNTLIIENPLYAVMNEPNSTMQRLVRKLALLDSVDEQSSAGKLDLIIQLPYTVRSELRKQQANERKKAIEEQLAGSKYGIAYIDSTEHITQLNRAVENNLMGQIEYLTNMVYSQLGITAEVMNGTADEKTMLNYNSRTIEPILSAITLEMRRKFLTKTARSQKQSIMFFRDPFKLVPVSNLADIADKFTRNEIMTSNEIRQIVGMKKSDDPSADELRNKNLNQSAEAMATEENPELGEEMVEEEVDGQAEVQNEFDSAVSDLDDIDDQLDKLENKLSHGYFATFNVVDEFLQHGIEVCDDFDSWLAHYASPYYDPVKAHEYYEKHKHLKGRVSTSGLNEEGRAIAGHIKENINSERKAKIDANNKAMNETISSSKASSDSRVKALNAKRSQEIQSSKAAMESKIQSFKSLASSLKSQHTNVLKSRIGSLNSLLRGSGHSDEEKEKIRAEVEKLREENSQKREEITSRFNDLTNKARSDHAARSESVRSDTVEATANARQQHTDTASKARTETKEKNAALKDEYDEKYSDEISKLKESGQYDKETKSKSSSAGSYSGKKVGYWEYQKNKKKK